MSATSHPVPNSVEAARGATTPWLVDALLLLLILFVQVGYSYWISVASIAAALALFRLRVQIAVGLRDNPWILALPLLMIWPLLFEQSVDLQQDIFRTGREAVAACLMLAIIKGASVRPPRVNVRRIFQCLGVIVCFLFILTAVQFVMLGRGIYLGIPAEFYSQGQSTIPDALDLRYSQPRPAATFAEPSYLAFVLLSMLLILAAWFERKHKGVVSIGIAAVTGLLSQAASFVLFAGAMGALFLQRILRGPAKLLLLPALAIAALIIMIVIVSVLGAQIDLLERLQGATSATGDFSIFVRIFGPLSALPDYLSRYPLGLPQSLVLYTVGPYAAMFGIDPEQYLMNGLYNLFFQYGFLGLPIALAFLLRRDIVLSVYLLACMMFNGGFLAIDKLAVIGLTIAIYWSIRRGAAVTAREVAFPAPDHDRAVRA